MNFMRSHRYYLALFSAINNTHKNIKIEIHNIHTITTTYASEQDTDIDMQNTQLNSTRSSQIRNTGKKITGE